MGRVLSGDSRQIACFPDDVMPDLPESRILHLKDFGPPDGLLDRVRGRWSFGVGRLGGDEFLLQVFRLGGGTDLPKGYRDSICQRYKQWEDLGGAASALEVVLEEEADGGMALAVAVPDGESLPAFLQRSSPLPERLGMRLCLELVLWLRLLADSPRLFSNADPADFLVIARDGAALGIQFCPVAPMIREESVFTDFHLARSWMERLSRLHAFFKGGGRSLPFEVSSPPSRAFRPLIKELDSGRERSLSDWMEEIAQIFRKDMDPSGAAKRTGGLPDPGHAPMGPLATHLRNEAARAEPERFGAGGEGASVRGGSSLFDLISRDGTRCGRVLPPEHWFERSLIDPLNRRLSHPFMKTHPQCPRVRAVYCDENLTLLTGDPVSSLPLPGLLTLKDGLGNGDWLRLAGKLHRALSQFESAGFAPELESPWQIELQLEPGRSQARPSWEELAEMEMEDWPAWDVLIRVERSTESFLPGGTNRSWRQVMGRLGGKFFPALLAWGIDWKRFQWSARGGILEREPLSWDDRLLALFEAARDHLDAHSAKQREKLLTLLGEGLGLG